MKFKRLMLVTFVLLAVLTIGAVSAGDDMQSDGLAVDGDGGSIESPVDDGDLLSVSEDDSDVANPGDKTFADVRTLIGDAEDDEVNLSGVYVGDGDPIEITESLTINGNGATLDADKKGSIFEVSCDNLVIKNLTFKNSIALKMRFIPEYEDEGTYGSAIIIAEGCSVEIINCNFINCSAMEGGAIWSEGQCSVRNSKFTDCSSGFNSAAIQLCDGASYEIENCEFTDCVSDNNGGAIYSRDGDRGSISNSNFTRCSSPWGGAFISDYGVHEFIGCNFEDCSGAWGGAINFCNGEATLIGCNFVNCIALDEDAVGGAINFRGDNPDKTKYTVISSSFSNCVAKSGGAIKHDDGFLSVNESTFTDCFAEEDGGAISSNPGAFTMDCVFANCTTSDSSDIGGAVRNVLYTDCVFDGENVTGGEISPDDEVDLWVNTWDVFSTNPDYLGRIFATVTVPEGMQGNVIFRIDENELYNKELSEFDPVRVDGDIYNISLGENGQFIFEGLNSGDVVGFSFIDENGDEKAYGEYILLFGDDTVIFIESDDEINVNIWDKDDERGTLYTDCEGRVVSVDVMDGSEGTIFIIVNGDDENPFSWDIECEEWEDFPYHEWHLEDLDIEEAGEYDLLVKCNDEFIAFATLNVMEWDENSYRVIMDDEDGVVFSLFCPEGSAGVVNIRIEKDDDGEMELVSEDAYEITSEDFNGYIEFAMQDYVKERQDYHISIDVNDGEFSYGNWFWWDWEDHGEEIDSAIFLNGNALTNDTIVLIPVNLSDEFDDEFEVILWDGERIIPFEFSELEEDNGFLLIRVLDLFTADEVGEGMGVNILVQFYSDGEKAAYCQPEDDEAGIDVYTSPYINDEAYLLEDGFVVSFRGFDDVDDEFNVTVSLEGSADIVKTFRISELVNIDEEGSFYKLHLSDLEIAEPGEYAIAVRFTLNGEELVSNSADVEVATVNIVAHGPDEDEDPVISDVAARIFHIGATENAAGFVRLFIGNIQIVENISFADLEFDDWPSHYGRQIYLNNYKIAESGNYTLKVAVYDENGNQLGYCENPVQVEVGDNAVEFYSGPYGSEGNIEFMISTPLFDGQCYNIYLNGKKAGNYTVEGGVAISDEFIDKYFEVEFFKPGHYDVNVTFFDGENEIDFETGSFSVLSLNATSDKEIYIYGVDSVWISFKLDEILKDYRLDAYYLHYWDRIQADESMVFNPYGDEDFNRDELYHDGVVSFDVAWPSGPDDPDYRLDLGTNYIHVTYRPWDDEGIAFADIISFTVVEPDVRIDPALAVSADDITEGADAVITVTTNSTFSGDVSVQIGTSNYTVAVTNGIGTLKVSGLSAGTYTAVATFAQTDVFNADVKNTTFAVKAKAATVIGATDVTTTFATSKTITVTLTDANGNPLVGKTVRISLNGDEKSLTTDDRGQASYAISTGLAPNTYSATIAFDGDAGYVATTGSAKVVVNKAKPVLIANKKTFKIKKAKKYTVTLKTDKKKAMKNAKVTITVKAKGKKVKITKKTNNKGKATFNLKKLTVRGKFTATVKFAGNTNYKAVTKKVKITVK